MKNPCQCKYYYYKMISAVKCRTDSKLNNRRFIMSELNEALEMHAKWNGKLDIVSKAPVKSNADLAVAYTPGVAEPCKVIAEDKNAAYKYTMKSNTIAVISDGSAT